MGRKKSTTSRALASVPVIGNVFGADPHKRTVTASVLDERGGVLGTETFRVSGDGHRAMAAWALSFGPIVRWGIEGASGLGRHTSMYLIDQGHDVRDVCPTRTAEQSRRRGEGKTDALDSVRVARETQADPAMPTAFKRAGGDAGPDEVHELMSLWHKARRSILKSRQHLLNEAEHLLRELPEELREILPDTSDVRPRLNALGRRPERMWDPATELRLRLLDGHRAAVADLDAQDRNAAKALKELARRVGSTMNELCGIAERIEAELLVEVGDPAASPAPEASPASTAPPRFPPPAPKAPEHRSGTASTAAATAASTLACTAWPSPSCAASPEPGRSTTTPAAAATPRRRPCASSSATSATSSTGA